MLSEELEIPFMTELLRLASDDSNNEELFAKADEKLKKSLLLRSVRKAYNGELIPPDSDDLYP